MPRHAVLKWRCGPVTRPAAAGERYGLPGLHLVAGLDADFGKMAVEGSEARAVVYVDAGPAK